MYRIAVTNRHLCKGDFLERIEWLAEGSEYDAILLREKDLTEDEYRVMAENVLAVCRRHEKRCILHNFWQTAMELNHPQIHLPLPVLEELPESEKSFFTEIGSSVHSIRQAEQAERFGVTYMCAGHIFQTDCKKGLAPRGLEFLKDICENAHVPVYGIGGITQRNERLVCENGAAGVCVMSGCMR